jgi:hypothetical protein
LLKESKQNGTRHSGRGDQRAESNRPTPPQLRDLGISKQQSSDWLAEIALIAGTVRLLILATSVLENAAGNKSPTNVETLTGPLRRT